MHNCNKLNIKNILIFTFLFVVLVALASSTVAAGSSETDTSHYTSKKASIDQVVKYKNGKFSSKKIKISTKKKSYKIKSVVLVIRHYYDANGTIVNNTYNKTYNGKSKTKLSLSIPKSTATDRYSFYKVLITYKVGKKSVKESTSYNKAHTYIDSYKQSSSVFKSYYTNKGTVKYSGTTGKAVSKSATFKLVAKKKRNKIKSVTLYFYDSKSNKVSKTYNGKNKVSLTIKLSKKYRNLLYYSYLATYRV